MSQASSCNTTSRITSSSPGALRPCIVPQFTAQAMAFPVTGFGHVDRGFVPVIHFPDRVAYRWSRFPRNTKLTAAEALRYAEHRIHYLQIRAAEKCRKHERSGSLYPFAIAAE
jgi:hypothetical protein